MRPSTCLKLNTCFKTILDWVPQCLKLALVTKSTVLNLELFFLERFPSDDKYNFAYYPHTGELNMLQITQIKHQDLIQLVP